MEHIQKIPILSMRERQVAARTGKGLRGTATLPYLGDSPAFFTTLELMSGLRCQVEA